MAPFAQACSQVLRFGGELHIKGNDFCFYCMFKTIFSGHNKSKRGTTKVREAQQKWGAVPRMPLRGYAPGKSD